MPRGTGAASRRAGNPLRAGLRLERVPDPCAFVLFGATGDLAHRKVMPAIYQLWRTNLLPAEFSLVAVARRPYTDEIVRRRGSPVPAPVRPSPADRRGRLGRVRQAHHVPPARLRRRRRLRRPERQPRQAGRGPRNVRQQALLSGRAALAGDRDRAPDRADGDGPRDARRRLAAGRDREAVRPRHRIGAPPEPRGRPRPARVAGLPHRPLPGQGDGPQPAGLPLRQRHLRAGLEPQLRGPRADHGGRVDRRRETRLLLRGDRRQPATSCRTTCSS